MDPGQPFIKRVFTYIRVKRSPLVVTMVSGGSSVIQRGYNQMAVLEPERFSMDPDYPDDKVSSDIVLRRNVALTLQQLALSSCSESSSTGCSQ